MTLLSNRIRKPLRSKILWRRYTTGFVLCTVFLFVSFSCTGKAARNNGMRSRDSSLHSLKAGGAAGEVISPIASKRFGSVTKIYGDFLPASSVTSKLQPPRKAETGEGEGPYMRVRRVGDVALQVPVLVELAGWTSEVEEELQQLQTCKSVVGYEVVEMMGQPEDYDGVLEEAMCLYGRSLRLDGQSITCSLSLKLKSDAIFYQCFFCCRCEPGELQQQRLQRSGEFCGLPAVFRVI